MKKTKSMFIDDSTESRELFLYAVNTEKFYNSFKSAVKCLAKKYVKNQYDSNKAIDAYYPIMHNASNNYYKDFGYKFTVTEKYTAAATAEKYYFENVVNNDLN